MRVPNIASFIEESNKIEGIVRPAHESEIALYDTFLNQEVQTPLSLELFVSRIQPGAVLRSRPGMDVRVGDYYPPPGGSDIPWGLGQILDIMNEERTAESAWTCHLAYEDLHPFTDGNGRSGRALWLWQMRGQAPLGFLHTFYYQTLKFNS